MNVQVKSITLILIVFLNCKNVPQNAVNQSGAELRPGWKLVEARGEFSFTLPQDMKQQKVQGIDSYVEAYQNDRVRVSFDLGFYSDTLTTYAKKQKYRELTKMIDGKQAKIIMFHRAEKTTEYEYYAAVHFPDLRENGYSRETTLTMDAEFKNESEWEIAQMIFDSIHFLK